MKEFIRFPVFPKVFARGKEEEREEEDQSPICEALDMATRESSLRMKIMEGGGDNNILLLATAFVLMFTRLRKSD